MARYCDKEISVWIDSGGFPCTKAAARHVSSHFIWGEVAERGEPTLCPQILCPLQVIHGLQGLGLLPRESLLVIIFAGAAEAVEKDAAGRCVENKIDDEKDQSDQDGRAKG